MSAEAPSFIAMRAYDLRDLLFQPGVFFARHEKHMKAAGGVAQALAVAALFKGISALVNAYWVASTAAVIQRLLFDVMRVGSDLAFERPELFRSWIDGFMGFGAILLGAPWVLAWGVGGGLLRVLVFALAVHLALVIWPPAAGRRAVGYSTTLKIVCYAQAPVVLSIVPGAGAVLGWALALSAAAFGLGKVYGGGWGRGIGYALFPYVLGSAAFMLSLCALALFALSLFNGLH